MLKLQFTPSTAPYEASAPDPVAVRNMKIVDAMQPWLKAKVHEIGLSDVSAKFAKPYRAAKAQAHLTASERAGKFRQRAVRVMGAKASAAMIVKAVA